MSAPESGSELGLDGNNSNNPLLSESGDVEQVLLQAVTFHQLGQIDDAARLYRDILLKLPLQPNANHNLGVIALEAKDIDASLSLFKTALEVAPEEPQYWTSYIDALLQADQFDYAGQVLAHGVEGGLEGIEVDSLKRRLADALLIPQADDLSSQSPVSSSDAEAALVDAQQANEKLETATAKAVAKVKNNGKPNSSEMNVLVSLFNQGRLVESEPLAIKMTQRYPRHGLGWKVLGAIRQQRRMVEEALYALKMAAELLPNDREAQYNLGNCFYDQQQLDEAVVCYKKSIKLAPNFAQAHYNLGNVFKHMDCLEQAKASYKKALKIEPNNVQIAYNLAHVLYEQELFSEAKSYFELALKIQDNFAAAHVGLGAALQALGRLSEAEERFRDALSINPNDVDAYNNLGDLLKKLGKFSEAEGCYRTALAITPESADTYIKLGSLLKLMGMSVESASSYTKALNIDPLREEVHNDLGLALADQGRFSEAEVSYQNALKIAPNYWKAYNNLGLALHSMGRFPEAELAFDKAIELNPTEALVYSNLSLPLVAQGYIKKAEDSLKRAIEITPEYVNAYINLGTNYLAQGLAQEAESAFLKALKFEPDSIKAKSNLLFTMNYSGGHSADYRLEQACQYDRIVSDKLEQKFTSWQDESPVKRLRVGLVSGDLRQHPVAYFLENWAQHVDSSRVELIAYLTDSREDAVTARLKPHFSGWKSLVGLSDQAAAQLIHSDAVHILLDLSGHTAGNRLPVFAWKPAPVQVSWLGYFATTGMAAIDYFIADEVGVPESNKTQFVEKIKYLPDTRLCFTAPEFSIEVSPLPALTNGYITLGSFQTMVKAGGEVLALWAEVMNALPNAKLRWQCKSFEDATVADDLRQRLAQLGVHSDRVTLLGSVAREAYLVAHAEVDMILDTFPYPGGTTTCEALWMGVPTLTLAGNTLIARQGASLLAAAGLGDWVVASKADYVSKALLVARDIDKLANLRAKLRQQVLASPLFDAPCFARNMETALWDMWRERQNNHSPQQPASLGKQMFTDSPIDDIEQSLKPSVVIVSATKLSESHFWSQSALGLSLKRHLKQDVRLSVKVAFENSRGLSEIFNECIDQADEDSILVFIHDDIWIDEANFADAIIQGLESFDVIGVAGNRRRIPNQSAWAFIDHQFTWDCKSNLSGRVAYGKHAFGEVEDFGAVPAECELLDGAFLATKKHRLQQNNVRFDPQFDFHFYDVDFCRSARKAGLKLGTWLVSLTHQSPGAYGSQLWISKYILYLNKWETVSAENEITLLQHEFLEREQNLQQAMNEVLQMALEHQNAGQIEQAEQLYLEILNIQPQHAEANHHLGVIEVNQKGALAALPRLEIAIQVKPENEQFWVSYVDALMQSGATDTAVDALELGQRFGLTAKTAQLLAKEFVENLEEIAKTSQKTTLALQASVMEALQEELKPSKKHKPISPNLHAKAEPVFYIWAPHYTETSSGIKVLHLLCDRLNGLGYEAYVTTTNVNAKLKTPQITPELIEIHKQVGRLQIAIYPEVQMGNPISVPNVVRYLLNKPNFFLTTSWFGSFHQDERVLHYDDTFAIPWVASEGVRVQSVDRSIFTPPIDSNAKRSGFLVYSHRVAPDLDNIPDRCKPYQVISMDDPKSPKELAKLYQQSAGMIVYHKTAAVVEAMLCGCPVIFCSSRGLQKSSVFYNGYDDFACVWDFDEIAYEQAKKTINLFPAIYDANEKPDIQALAAAIGNIVSHFQLNKADCLETTPAFLMDRAHQYMEQRDVKNAVISYRQLIANHPSNVEGYFRMGDSLATAGLLKHGLEVLVQGEAYLAQLPKHEYLKAIRGMYYLKLSEVCLAMGDLALANQYFEQCKQYQSGSS
ncbi:MAG: tetratricopeptide repeat protein [Methylotenera sp.]|nr:tetratricopeptide repeat protein [Methylotenera sp.]